MKNFVTIVSGLPRSGTSLMMQMLIAGGMTALTDGQRAADQNNPRGYFELEAVKHTRTDHSWLAQAEGKVVKVVHLLIQRLPPKLEYRVIFMRRDLSEIVASQRAMLLQLGRPGANIPDAKLATIFEGQLAEALQWISNNPNFHILQVQHREVIEQPILVAQRIAAFLGGDLDSERMAAAVEPGLYRQRHNQSLPEPLANPPL